MKQFLRTFICILMAEFLVLTSFDVTGLAVYAEDETVLNQEETGEPEADVIVADNETDLSSLYEADAEDAEALLMNLGTEFTANGNTNLPDNRIYGTFKFAQGGDQPATFVYSDAYFNHSSTEYDADLAVFLQSVAMCAFNAREGGRSDYSHKYGNIEEFLTKCGYEEYEHNSFYEIKPQHHSMGVSIAMKKVRLGDGSIQPILAIACRGGNYEAEWVGNVCLGAEGDAEGFGLARDHVIDFLLTYLDEHFEELVGEDMLSPKIWVCGYSRGSATANLTGNYIDYALLDGSNYGDPSMTDLSSYLNRMGVRFEDIFVYGFEVPQALHGTSEYQSPDMGNIWCIVDPSDPVPKVAPSTMGFTHAGTVIDPTENVSDQGFLRQMDTIDKGMADDWRNQELRGEFVAREWGLYGLFHNLFVDDTSKAMVNLVGDDIGEYLDNLLGWVVRNMLVTIGETHVRDAGLNAREMYAKYYQKPIAILTAALMGTTGDAEKNLKNALKNIVSSNVDGWFYTSVVAAIPTAIVTTEAKMTLSAVAQLFLTRCLNDMEKNTAVTAVMGTDDIAVLKSRVSDLSWLAVNLGLSDLLLMFQHAATAVHYSGEIFMPHNPEYVLAYLRCQAGYSDTNRFQITVTPGYGETLENIKIEVYHRENVKPYDKVLLATMTKDGLEVAPDGAGYFKGGGTYDDKKMMLCSVDLNRTDYSQWFEVSCIDKQDTNTLVKLDYDYQKDGTKHKQTTQDFETIYIPVMYGDVLQMRASSERITADFSKYVSMTPKFVNEKMEPIPEGTATATSNGQKSEFTSLSVQAENRFKVTPPEGYVYGQVLLPATDCDGRHITDIERGRVFTKYVSDPTAWDWNTCSDDLYFVCMSRVADGRVNARAVYQHRKGTGKTLIDEQNYESVITIENLTQHTSVHGTGDQFLNAFPGDKIRVEISADTIPVEEAWVNWDPGVSRITDGTEDGYSYTFTMPETGVSLTARLMQNLENKVTLTYDGRWANPSQTLPTELTPSWRLAYIDSAYTDISFKNAAHYYPTRHVLQLNGDRPGKAWIEAPSYGWEDSGDMVFDHWEAYETATGKAWTDDNAYISVYVDGSGYRKESVCPNGFKEPVIALENLTKSMTLVPVYRKARYKLTVQYSTHSKKTYELEVGETIDLEDRCTHGYEHDYWSSSYESFTESVDQYGQVTREKGETVIEQDNTDPSGSYTYTMPRGDATVIAHEKKSFFNVSWTGDSIRTSSGETVFEFKDKVEFVPDQIPHGMYLEGISVVSGDLVTGDIRYEYDGNGDIATISFKQPATDVEIRPVLKNRAACSLTLVNATARYEDETLKIGEPESGTYPVYEKDIIRIKADKPADGKYFKEWQITAGDVELTDLSEGDVYEALLQMPETDVTIEAVMEDLIPVTDLTLAFTGEFSGNRMLPTSVFCEGTGVTDTTMAANVEPYEYWDNPARFGQDYACSCTLTPEEGYVFDTNTTVTWEGKPCTVTLQKDGSALVEAELSTPPAYVTKLGDVQDLAGVEAGQSLEEIGALLRPGLSVRINDGELLGYMHVNWDMAHLTDAAGDPVEYDPENLTTTQEFYVTGTLDVSSMTTDVDEFAEGGLLFADGVPDTVRVRVTTTTPEYVSSPYICSDHAPGIYREGQTVELACDSEDADILYLIGDPTESYDAQDLMESGWLYDPDDPICLEGIEDEETEYVIWAMAVPSDEKDDRRGSQVVDFSYTIDMTPEAIYKVTVIGGSGSGEYHEGDLVGILAPAAQNMTFAGFEILSGIDTIRTVGNGGSFEMPANDVQILATYTIDRISIRMNEPIAGETLPQDPALGEGTPSVVGFEGEEGSIVTYTRNGEPVTGTAQYSAVYTGAFTLNAAEDSGCSFTADTQVLINGSPADVIRNEDGTLSVSYRFPRTAEKTRYHWLRLIYGRAYDPETGEELPVDGEGRYMVTPGQVIRIIADTITGSTFHNWRVNSEKSTQTETKKKAAKPALLALTEDPVPAPVSPTDDIVMPEENLTVVALYKTLITKLELTVPLPELNEELARHAHTNTEGVANPDPEIIWIKDDVTVWGNAEPGFYMASINVVCEEGAILDPDVVVTINGMPCNFVVSDERNGAVLAQMFSTESALITEVKTPSDVTGIPAHTPVGTYPPGKKDQTVASALPAETTVIIEETEVPARINWDLSSISGYDPEDAEKQTFTVKGTVEPIFDGTPFRSDDTFWADGVSDEIEIRVTVEAEKTEPKPAPDDDDNNESGTDSGGSSSGGKGKSGSNGKGSGATTGDANHTDLWLLLALAGAAAVLAGFRKRENL